jgi:hypothetical protein
VQTVILLYLTLSCKSHSHSFSCLLSISHLFQLFGAGGAPAFAANCSAASAAAAAVLTPRPPTGTSSHVSFPTNCPLTTAHCPLPTFHPRLVHTTACPRPHHMVRRYLCPSEALHPQKLYICIPLPSSLHQILSTASCQLQLLLLRPLLSP